MNTKINKDRRPPKSVEYEAKIRNEKFDKDGRLQAQIRIEFKKESK